MAEVAPDTPYAYDLERLFVDQPDWFARETVPHTLAWLGAPKGPLRFSLLLADGRASELTVRWSREELTTRLPDLEASVARLLEGRSIHAEQVPQYGAYGLAGVVASAVLGVRVLRLSAWAAPDLVFDNTPGALRGIEVAGRSHRGAAGLRELAEEKAPPLRSAPGVMEAWLSLWCTTPTVSLLLKVRP
ncbi:MAG: hypothetical protein U0324_47240 [Polyangiales bacterium]